MNATPPLLQTLCQHTADFYRRGWLMGTAGNFSMRSPENSSHYWVTASGLDKGQLQAEDFIHLAEGLQKVDPSDPRKPSDEALIHELIYQQFPEVQVVYHVHPPCGTWVSRQYPEAIGSIPLPKIEMMKGLGLPSHESEASVLLIPNHQSMPILCEWIQNLAQQTPLPVLMIQGHGLYAWGSTPQAAKRHVEISEFLFQQRQWDFIQKGAFDA